MHVTLLRFLMV